MKKILTTSLIAASLAAFATSASAATVIDVDFEGLGNTDDNLIATYDKFPPSPASLAPSNNGFGSDRAGVNLVGTNNVYSFRYTNSGLTSTFETIGNLTAGVTYTLSFDISLDDDSTDGLGWGFVTFDGTETSRTNTSGGMSNLTTSVLAEGTVDTIGGTSYTFSYTADGLETALGQDVAIRFIGATTSANLDNVLVTVPEPSAALLVGGLGVLLLLRRRRR
jgi:hypothetical protein